LSRFTKVLKRSIMDYEDKIRRQSGDKYLDVYDELSALLSLSIPTIRKWTNEFNPDYPKVNQLTALCKIMDDKKPLEFLKDYWGIK